MAEVVFFLFIFSESDLSWHHILQYTAKVFLGPLMAGPISCGWSVFCIITSYSIRPRFSWVHLWLAPYLVAEVYSASPHPTVYGQGFPWSTYSWPHILWLKCILHHHILQLKISWVSSELAPSQSQSPGALPWSSGPGEPGSSRRSCRCGRSWRGSWGWWSHLVGWSAARHTLHILSTNTAQYRDIPKVENETGQQQ